ncbi:MAG: acylphosphatase [Bacteroidota bacterium]|nr:acylphosphatase [Bacteroidota bacterium]
MIKHIDITIIGEITNIGFRFQSMMAAYDQNVKGLVKYLENGIAYIEAEGTSLQLETFIQQFKNAPGAKIKDIKTVQGNIKNYQDFEII